ncbi:MAG: hypothetical protein K6G11_04085 [Lachnospiraceae bacterium]|nr:hypothetical protein [Lachnospiraceae bacterium]
MSSEQKSLQILSVVELVLALAGIVLGIFFSANKAAEIVGGVFPVITALLCLASVKDASKAKPAKILLGVTIVLNLAGIILAVFSKDSGISIASAAIDVCIAAYMFNLIKKIHGGNQ